MTHVAPDLYMASSDGIALEEPRRWRLHRLKASNRSDDLLVILVDPPIPGGPYGFKTQLNVVVIAAHLEGDSLFPINTFPVRPLPVYVARLLIDDTEGRTKLESYEFELFAWAELYPSEAEARAKLTDLEAHKVGRRL